MSNKLKLLKAFKDRLQKGKICPKGIAWAKRTFDKYPSAYANLAASKYCKDPKYGKSKLKKGDLQRWLDQRWKRINSSGKIVGECGTSKNTKNPDRCLPESKARSLSQKERAATAKKKKKEGKKGKQFVANTKKAKVSLKKAEDDGIRTLDYSKMYPKKQKEATTLDYSKMKNEPTLGQSVASKQTSYKDIDIGQKQKEATQSWNRYIQDRWKRKNLKKAKDSEKSADKSDWKPVLD